MCAPAEVMKHFLQEKSSLDSNTQKLLEKNGCHPNFEAKFMAPNIVVHASGFLLKTVPRIIFDISYLSVRVHFYFYQANCMYCLYSVMSPFLYNRHGYKFFFYHNYSPVSICHSFFNPWKALLNLPHYQDYPMKVHLFHHFPQIPPHPPPAPATISLFS